MRNNNFQPGDMRPVEITTGYLMTAEGSALIKVGNTHVLCAATVEDSVPSFLRNSGKGWVTAEYSMLPRSTAKRTPARSPRAVHRAARTKSSVSSDAPCAPWWIPRR